MNQMIATLAVLLIVVLGLQAYVMFQLNEWINQRSQSHLTQCRLTLASLPQASIKQIDQSID
jgi:hypothetical protein